MRTTRTHLFSISVLTGIVLLTGCGKPREGITLAGSTAFQPFAEKLADH
jgi:ABC-type phosphate transport system substrate-binding protein